ncbi:hypothetical protein Goari_003052, partial [Gossypium aridum]|nr:hypothetical protein [Gossypium aridum]
SIPVYFTKAQIHQLVLLQIPTTLYFHNHHCRNLVNFHISFKQQTNEIKITAEPVPTHIDRSLSVLQRFKSINLLGS